MQDLNGRNALITGGAGGIGLAMARALVSEGVNVALADIDRQALQSALETLDGSNARTLGLELDVTNRERYAEVADQVEAELGPIHIFCNNAGVYRGGTLDSVTYEDWDWVLGVNIGGVVNGIQTIARRMRDHGAGGHIVNTASMAGIAAAGGLGVYNTSKFAVVGLSEALRLDLAPHGIGVSVLCPGMVRTDILRSERNRPASLEGDDPTAKAAADVQSAIMTEAMNAGIDASEVAELVIQGIRDNQFYLFPHPELKGSVEQRASELLDAFGEPDPARLEAQQQFMAALLANQNDGDH